MIQIGKSVADFAREAKAFQLGSGQPVFKPLDAARGNGEAVNDAARRQEESGDQYPEANPERRFHKRKSTLRRRWTSPRCALSLRTAQVPCREDGRIALSQHLENQGGLPPQGLSDVQSR